MVDIVLDSCSMSRPELGRLSPIYTHANLMYRPFRIAVPHCAAPILLMRAVCIPQDKVSKGVQYTATGFTSKADRYRRSEGSSIVAVHLFSICEPLQMRWRPFIPSVLSPRYAHSTALKLRPYQEACLESCLDALNEGYTKIGVSLPTGAGKTVVFVSLLERLQTLSRTTPEAARSIVIVNSVELARQAANQARKLFPHWTVEIEQGARHTASGLADLYVLFCRLWLWC